MPYGKLLGQQLRRIRLQKKYSLKDAEEKSKGVFKSSVLGAYERGDRQITVHRLYKLADFYKIPISQLLIKEREDLHEQNEFSQTGKVRIDLEKLEKLELEDKDLLTKYISLIKAQRGDVNDRIITLRRDDLRSLACLFYTTPSQLSEKIEKLNITVDKT
jgi:transcriptional regulator with XRE-family HTH domain